jgi:deoxyribonuclease-4
VKKAPDSGPLIGAHMSVAGGLTLGIERALNLRTRAVQIFTKNASRWNAKALEAEESAAFRSAWEGSGLAPVIAHGSYLINLASPDPVLRRKSIEGLVDELQRAEALGIEGLVVHPGAHMGSGVEAGCDRVAESIGIARSLAPAPGVRILLEAVAGQGTTLGRRFEELTRIRDAVEADGGIRDGIGVCFDTCHVHAAGYDLITERGVEATFEEFDAVLGLGTLRLFHLNDSKNERGSRVDRHEHLGRGRIGPVAFARILRDPRFHAVPKLLETPKGADGVVMDRRNLAFLRRLAAETTDGPRGDGPSEPGS